MADELELNDAVFASEDSRQLEGVVAWKGPVDFAEGDDWIGVRLTGGCVGLGKNDGSVNGREYFNCPANCGIFVQASFVTKRQLTRLEELRLKRELGTKKPSTAATTTTTSSAATSTARTAVLESEAAAATSSITPQKKASDEPVEAKDLTTLSSVPRTDSKATLTKLEELRLRRAALKEKKEATIKAPTPPISTPPPVQASASVAPPTARSALPASAFSIASPAAALQEAEIDKLSAETQRLRSELQTTQLTLGDKENETKELQTKLSATETELANVKTTLDQTMASAATNAEASDMNQQIKDLQTKLAVTEQELQTTKTSLAQARAANTPQVVVTSAASDGNEERLGVLQSAVEDWKSKAEDAMSEVTNLKRQFDQEKLAHASAKDELSASRSEAAALRKEVQMISEQTEQRGTTDNSHYKELAKLQADVSAQKRKVEALEREKLDMEATIEDLTLDKEQLLEEKEGLEDQVDELRLDAESAQMEVEELKMELEDTRQVSAEASRTTHDGDRQDDEELASALSTQNLRLREALIRLREQTQLEKMELLRQIRDAEKDAESGRALVDEVGELRSLQALQAEEISDLKDMVEQGAAFEQMVEDLTDRLFSLEEENASLRTAVREMEEAAELTAEMEEVQADELKALSRDLEGRDAIIHNLEEAIKIQRRREDDFLRTVANYRTTVATLSQEKQALLELHKGGEGEKSDLIAASQSALARASQLVSDAAASRKLEAVSVLDSIDKDIYKALAFRLESLLPQNVVGLEISAIKGELMASKVIDRGSKTLESLSRTLKKAARPALASMEGRTALGDMAIGDIPEEVEQKASVMLYQAEFAHAVIDSSSGLIRLLAGSMWPDLLTPEDSTSVASILGHSIDELDAAIGGVLRSIKEEGDLSPEHANLGALRQTCNATMQSIMTDLQRQNDTLVPTSWNPPGLALVRHASVAKFAIQGAAAALSIVVGEEYSQTGLAVLYNKMEKASTQSDTACLRLSALDIKNDRLVDELSTLAVEWKTSSVGLVDIMKQCLSSRDALLPCNAAVDNILALLAQFHAALRIANLGLPEGGDRFHALSPEVDQSWVKLANLSRAVRSVDGDEDDVNYLVRSRAIEQQLADAIENEVKLEAASARAATLEKNLASKSKEVMMQTARMSELEKELAKGSVHGSRTIDLTASDEFGRLSEENRVLQDAMVHWQSKAEEYEMVLRDLKSPAIKGSKNRTPRRGMSSVSDLGPYGVGGGVDYQKEDIGALEATLFRPVLQQVVRDASKWKAAAIGTHLQDLPPLPVPHSLRMSGSAGNSLLELTAALSNYRLVKASSSIVDLTNHEKTPRAQLREMHAQHSEASERLHSIASRYNLMTV